MRASDEWQRPSIYSVLWFNGSVKSPLSKDKKDRRIV